MDKMNAMTNSADDAQPAAQPPAKSWSQIVAESASQTDCSPSNGSSESVKNQEWRGRGRGGGGRGHAQSSRLFSSSSIRIFYTKKSCAATSRHPVPGDNQGDWPTLTQSQATHQETAAHSATQRHRQNGKNKWQRVELSQPRMAAGRGSRGAKRGRQQHTQPTERTTSCSSPPVREQGRGHSRRGRGGRQPNRNDVNNSKSQQEATFYTPQVGQILPPPPLPPVSSLPPSSFVSPSPQSAAGSASFSLSSSLASLSLSSPPSPSPSPMSASSICSSSSSSSSRKLTEEELRQLTDEQYVNYFINYWFSQENLERDLYMARWTKNGYVPIMVIVGFPKMCDRKFTGFNLLQLLQRSPVVTVSPDRQSIRRRGAPVTYKYGDISYSYYWKTLPKVELDAQQDNEDS